MTLHWGFSAFNGYLKLFKNLPHYGSNNLCQNIVPKSYFVLRLFIALEFSIMFLNYRLDIVHFYNFFINLNSSVFLFLL